MTVDWRTLRAHALVLLATGAGILGMGMIFSGAMHSSLAQMSRGAPLLFIGLWWSGRALAQSMIASRQRKLNAGPPRTGMEPRPRGMR